MLADLQARKDARLVNCQRHPSAPLTIWNYTAQCQYQRAWDAVTLAARGLILHDDGRIVARGFQKFFNLSERQAPLPAEPYKVFDKLDGSLGVLYFIDGEPAVATRGSFTGPQAVRATRIFRERYAGYQPPPGTTAVFEIIYPENRVIVDYGPTEDLRHLGLVDNATGLVQFDLDPHWPGAAVQEFAAAPPDELATLVRSNAEGYVVRYRNGFQVKVKLADYLRQHRLTFNTSTRTIWEHLAADGTVADLIASIPDELYPFVREHSDRMLAAFRALEAEAQAAFATIRHLAADRRAFAEQARAYRFPGALFALLDGKRHTTPLWKAIEPEWLPARQPPPEDVA